MIERSMMEIGIMVVIISSVAVYIINGNVTQGHDPNCQPCYCYFQEGIQTHTLVADCAERHLAEIPDQVPNDVNVLLFSRNNMSHIENGTFTRFTNLSTIDVSYNDIHDIAQNGFDSLCNLDFLNMAKCLVSFNSTIKPSLFKPLKKLSTLLINRRNLRHDFMDTYPVAALQELLSLETLVIDGPENSPADKGFEKLDSLKHVSFSGHNGFCNFSTLDERTFSSLSHVEILNISSCSIKHIHPNTFKSLQNLTILDLSQNPCLYLTGIENATYGLRDSKKIQKLFFNEVVDAFAPCIEVRDALADNLQNTSLQELHLDRNRIEIFHEDVFEKFPSNLSIVSLQVNRFTYGRYLIHVGRLEGLQKLDLSGEPNYPIMPNRTWMTCSSFSDTYCSSNHGTYNMDFLTHLDPLDPIPLPPNLKILTIRNRYLPYVIKNLKFRNNSLKHLDLSYNILTSWHGYVKGLEGLEYIDISHNGVSYISYNFFKHFPSLKTLNMSANVLKMVLETENNETLFKALKNLTELNLSENILQNLPPNVFDGLLSLQVLNLSHNYLDEFNTNVTHMIHLHTIDCTHNNIRWIRHPIRKLLDELTEYKNVTLLLAYNTFYCSCENLDFLQWLINSNIKLGDIGNFKCIFSSGNLSSSVNLEVVIESLKNNCYNHLSVYIATTASTMLILTLIVFSVGFRYRWKMRYWYYAARLRYGEARNNDSPDFEFDAFISFADEDREFVVSELIDKLENEAGLRLNIHQRDFTAGRPIASNIIEAVKNSRKTLFILSEHFIQSYWCIYELQMANMESVTTGRDVIIVLRLKGLPTKNIPADILYRFQTESYIEYPEQDDKHLFWMTLVNSLKL